MGAHVIVNLQVHMHFGKFYYEQFIQKHNLMKWCLTFHLDEMPNSTSHPYLQRL